MASSCRRQYSASPQIERAISAFACRSNGCLIVTPGGAAQRPRDLIITLAAQHKLPTVYYERFLVAAGGFFSYGASLIDQHQRAASYVDRILRGKP